MSYIPLDDLKVYQMAMQIGEEVWAVVDCWADFPKKAIGGQFCEAADSIAANISEGHGRYHYKENRNHCFYARGSLLETKTWLTKGFNRKLISAPDHTRIRDLLSDCHFMLNKYIKSIGTSGSELKEPPADYLPNQDTDNLPF